jgi:3',5'-cyclic AMP phosphodiesterase CpdA
VTNARSTARGFAVVALIATLALSACVPGGNVARRRDGTRGRSARRGDRKVDVTVAGASVLRPMRFAVLGDLGAATPMQEDIARRLCRWRRRHPFSMVVTTGDNVYPDGAPERFDSAFFRPYRCLFESGVRFRSVLGNHDVVTRNGRPELEENRFGMRRRNYVVRRRGVRFVLMDSNTVRRDWLRRRLRTEPGDRWTVVAFHHPLYSPGTGHGSTAGFRPWMPRLFRRRDVDLVVNGHDHIYAVTRALDRIRYVVTGGGGAYLYGCAPKWFTARCVARHHFLYVVAGAEKIVVRAVPATGPPFHVFSTGGRS